MCLQSNVFCQFLVFILYEKMNNIFVSTEAIADMQEVMRQVQDRSCGAISTFIGTTRSPYDGKEVTHLSYEAYEPMTVSVMKEICDEIRSSWNVRHIYMQHKIGDVPVGDASVVIAISSVRRSDSLSAVSYAIDQVKARVPIWKKESYIDGTANWRHNSECFWLAPQNG